MEISQYGLAKEIGMPARRIGEIVAGKRAVAAAARRADPAKVPARPAGRAPVCRHPAVWDENSRV